MSKLAFIFPGQGSQTVGMGMDYKESYEESMVVFGQCEDVLGHDFIRLMQEGPLEQLTLTENAQPALVTASIAMYEVLKKEGIQPDYVSGHSLGEYSALVATGSLSFIDAVKTVRKRGELMEQAVPKGIGAMSAVMGFDARLLEAIIQEAKQQGQSVDIANYNGPGQIVISGSKEGVEFASIKAKDAGAKRVIPLNVSGPFHSELMKPASIQFERFLKEISMTEMTVPLVANVTATPIEDSSAIQELLVKQLYSPVRFEESINRMIEDGVTTFVEVGPLKVLQGLIRKINRNVTVLGVQDVEALQSTIAVLKERE
ncbi:malonyl CoA-ACP transacylase [Bacillus coahuilensis p1.1.43]|uniref:Malonyl CoA-acyl carrier protein transacylase n=1 Tax=Bacillus coahuilensis p1.1.43 TaxID=1150625 RepID=A0A147K9H5_9BACI|nr:ACP S-malonyltransferase [Bacillus coahuilensis]KUP07079.1 malonyl CoA-ACP transacylase [Bacillus coahuilensis p1.1.43]